MVGVDPGAEVRNGSVDHDALAAQAPGLYRFARSLVRRREDAEDLVHDTILVALERGRSLRAEAALGTWLHRVLHNLAVDRARRSARELLVDEVEDRWRDDAYTVDSAAVVERAEDRTELEDALVRLPFADRAVLVLHDVEGWTVRSIAERLGISLPAAKRRLRRGRMMLVSALAAGAERREALRGVPLRCRDARRRVSDHLDDALPAHERVALDAHLATCPTCPPLFAALVGTTARLGRLRDPDSVIPPSLVARIRRIVAP